MALYTKRGDGGFTDSGGGRTRKDAPAPTALGTLDELNAAVGLCLAEADRVHRAFIREALLPLQDELFCAGVDLAAATGGGPHAPKLSPAAVDRLERDIDTICGQLPELKHFILPGGSELAARLHLARTIARRAERAVIAAMDPARGAEHPVLAYVNRLSDLLFALARLANADGGGGDVTWAGGADGGRVSGS